MNNSNTLILEKIFHLGKRLENQRIYELLEPWTFDGFDTIEVQNAGKKISTFIGLPNLTFIITYKNQEKNVAGHIELNNNSDEGVFIEIDEKYKTDSEIILAILAHEICHKLIHTYGLSQYGYENEILTDVATVYTGLGKLSLNGCEVVKSSTDHYVEGSTTTTTTQKAGYLNRNQFAFVYKVICKMRRIPDNYALKNLSYAAIDALNGIIFKPNEELFYNDYVINKVTETFKYETDNLKLISALNTKLFKSIYFSINHLNKFNDEVHTKLKTTTDKYYKMANAKHSPDSLNFIKNLLLSIELENNNGKFNKDENILSSLNLLYSEFVNELIINGDYSINFKNRDYLYFIECPICKNKMRLKQDKLMKISCSKCKYPFIVDNAVIEAVNNYTISTKIKKTFSQKIKEIISIIKE